MGASGCGKSTVMQLIQRFYDVDAPDVGGEVRDGGGRRGGDRILYTRSIPAFCRCVMYILRVGGWEKL